MVEKIDLVISALSAGGIRARRGYPTEKYFCPESPVAAVNLYCADGESTVVAAEIYAEKATDCEDAAGEAMELLKARGASCTIAECQFQRMMGLYSQRVLAHWGTEGATQSLGFKLYRNGTQMPYVTGFSAVSTAQLHRFTADDGTISILRQTPVWEVTVEELIPLNVAPEADPDAAFTLEINRAGGGEVFPLCQWDHIQRTETSEGVVQVRHAKTWESRVVNSFVN